MSISLRVYNAVILTYRTLSKMCQFVVSHDCKFQSVSLTHTQVILNLNKNNVLSEGLYPKMEVTELD